MGPVRQRGEEREVKDGVTSDAVTTGNGTPVFLGRPGTWSHPTDGWESRAFTCWVPSSWRGLLLGALGPKHFWLSPCAQAKRTPLPDPSAQRPPGAVQRHGWRGYGRAQAASPTAPTPAEEYLCLSSDSQGTATDWLPAASGLLALGQMVPPPAPTEGAQSLGKHPHLHLLRQQRPGWVFIIDTGPRWGMPCMHNHLLLRVPHTGAYG